MECSIAVLMACFSWSNFYVDAHVTAIDKTFPHQEWRVSEYRGNGVIETTGQYVWTDRPNNPYGGVALGFELPFSNLRISAEVSHMLSSMRTDEDRGINAISLRAKWYPLRW